MKIAILASAVAIENRANNRALSKTSSPLAAASWRTTRLYVAGPVNAQKRAISVCSAVRANLSGPQLFYFDEIFGPLRAFERIRSWVADDCRS